MACLPSAVGFFIFAQMRLRPTFLAIIVWVVFFDVAFLWQWQSGAYRSEFGGHPDEAAHYVTGLFVREAVCAIPACVGSRSIAPLASFKQDAPDGFYSRYPKVALGVWPPLFYMVQSAWTIPFGTSRVSVLLLMAALAAVLGTVLWRALKPHIGPWPALAAGLVLLSLPLVREHYSMVMAETLCAITMFACTLAWGRFLDSGTLRPALWAAFWAGLAIMSKGTGVALALMLPLSLLLANRWNVLRECTRLSWWKTAPWWHWLISAGSVCAALGWTYVFRNVGRDKGGWLYSSPTWKFTNEAIGYYAGKVGLCLGIVLAILALLGLCARFLPDHRKTVASDEPSELETSATPPDSTDSAPSTPESQGTGIQAAAAALILAVYIFQIILPVGMEDRHILSLLPACLLFVGLGASYLVRRLLPSASAKRLTTTVAVAIILVGALQLGINAALHLVPPWRSQKAWTGFAPVADGVVAAQAGKGAAVLVSSDATGEGMFISEIAMRNPRPGIPIRRASKELGKMEWSGRDYQAKFDSEDGLRDFLLRSSLEFIVVDDSIPEAKRAAHHSMLWYLCERDTRHFWLVGSAPVVRGGEAQGTPVRLYRIRRN